MVILLQEKHGLKIRDPLPELVDFEIGDWMFSCESKCNNWALKTYYT